MDKIVRRNKKLNLLLQSLLTVSMYFFIYSNIGTQGITGRYKYIFGILLIPILVLYYLGNMKKIMKILTILLNKNIIILLVIGILLIISNCFNVNENILASNPLKELILNFSFDIIYLLFFLIILNKKRLEDKLYYLAKAYILSINLDNLFAILRYFSDEFNRICLFVYPAENRVMLHYIFSKERLVGLGGFFFGAGIHNAISLLLIYFIIKNKNISLRQKHILYILFIFNFIIGMLISRTTILGLGLIIIYGILIQKRKFFKFFKLNFLIFSFLLVMYQCIHFFPVEIQNKVNNFIFKQGKGSLNHLLEFYNIVPRQIKTILIGDLKWGNVNTGYYMGIDVGYLRYIFYGGIFFLILMIFFNYFLIPSTSNIKIKKLATVLFLFYLILMLKGYITYLGISIILWFIVSWEKRRRK